MDFLQLRETEPTEVIVDSCPVTLMEATLP